MTIDLYTSATPNGYKVSIMLEELKLKYKVHKIDLGTQTQKEEWFLKLNPNGRIPVLKDNENNKVIFESGAILYYLAIKYNKFFFEEKRIDIMQWLMFQMSAIGPMQGQANVFLDIWMKKYQLLFLVIKMSVEDYMKCLINNYKTINGYVENTLLLILQLGLGLKYIFGQALIFLI